MSSPFLLPLCLSALILASMCVTYKSGQLPLEKEQPNGSSVLTNHSGKPEDMPISSSVAIQMNLGANKQGIKGIVFVTFFLIQHGCQLLINRDVKEVTSENLFWARCAAFW